MVKGWQKRVEEAEARRTASKQKRSKRNNRAAYKSLVHDMVGFFDTHAAELRKTVVRDDSAAKWTLHVWLDSNPEQGKSNSGNSKSSLAADTKKDTYDDDEEEAGRGKKGKRKGSGKKKRAEEIVAGNQAEQDEAAPLQCRSYFYHQTCKDMIKSGKGKKQTGGCRNFHLENRDTLAAILKGGKTKNRATGVKDVLTASEEQMVEATDGGDSTGMELLYCISIPVVKNTDSEVSISENLAGALAERGVGIGSVVYVALNNVLVFDRYRAGGLVITDILQLRAALGDDKTASSVIAGAVDSDSGNAAVSVPVTVGDLALPGPILEAILTFLPDTAVARMSSVCKHWNSEIGTTSPDLWRHLLQRRGWPIADAETDDDTGTTDFAELRGQLKADFLSHYSGVRDLQAIKDAIDVLMVHGNDESSTEMVFQNFSARQSAPQYPNGCIEMQVWSPNLVLAAYSQDSTVRLFQAIDKRDQQQDNNSARAAACREIACISVDMHRNTKKKNCGLVAMTLDEKLIVCLCQVFTKSKERDYPIETFKLVFMTREKFLVNGSSATDTAGLLDLEEEGILDIIDIAETVMDYLLSLEDGEARRSWGRLFDHLEGRGEVSHVEVLASKSVVACGDGRFLFEVSISVAQGLIEQNDDIPRHYARRPSMVVLGRKLVLFSATDGAIVWMDDSCHSERPLPGSFHDMTISCLRHVEKSESRTSSSVAVTSATSSEILLLNIMPSGHVTFIKPIKAAEVVRNEILDGWEMRTRFAVTRPIVVTETDILVSDRLVERVDDDRSRLRKAVISFYPRVGEGTAYHILELDGNYEIVRMKPLRDQHVVVLLREYCAVVAPDHDVGYDHSLVAILLHVPTRRVVHRLFITGDISLCAPSPTYDLPIILASAGDTVGVGIRWNGLVMTGADVRAVGDSVVDDNDTLSKGGKRKKKVKRQPVRKNVRGMSLRNAAS